MNTEHKLTRAKITRVLRESQLAEFTTKQHGTAVQLVVNTCDLGWFQHALSVNGFAQTEPTWNGDGTSTIIVSHRWSQQTADKFLAAAAAAMTAAISKVGA